jgi:hypothetical protein
VLRLESCRNVHLRRLELDSDPHPYTEDVVTGMNLLLYKRLAPLGIDICASEWIDCEEVVVHAATRFVVYVESSCGVSFRRCALQPRAGSLGGLNADGYHCRSNRFGPFFEDCRIVRVLDDCFNLYSRVSLRRGIDENGDCKP